MLFMMKDRTANRDGVWLVPLELPREAAPCPRIARCSAAEASNWFLYSGLGHRTPAHV